MIFVRPGYTEQTFNSASIFLVTKCAVEQYDIKKICVYFLFPVFFSDSFHKISQFHILQMEITALVCDEWYSVPLSMSQHFL